MMAAKASLPKALSYRNEKGARIRTYQQDTFKQNHFPATFGQPMLEML
jgi:hypothetical protein